MDASPDSRTSNPNLLKPRKDTYPSTPPRNPNQEGLDASVVLCDYVQDYKLILEFVRPRGLIRWKLQPFSA